MLSLTLFIFRNLSTPKTCHGYYGGGGGGSGGGGGGTGGRIFVLNQDKSMRSARPTQLWGLAAP